MRTPNADVVRPMWVLIVAAFGIAWNSFGIVQLVDFVTRTRTSLMMDGMPPAAAELYYGLPTWMQLVFAVGSVGGLVGSLALMMRPRLAAPLLAASLVGYLALWTGDLVYGLFQAFPGQMAILTTVVVIAVALLAAALLGRRGERPFKPHEVKTSERPDAAQT